VCDVSLIASAVAAQQYSIIAALISLAFTLKCKFNRQIKLSRTREKRKKKQDVNNP
jgi:hypothetical protein